MLTKKKRVDHGFWEIKFLLRKRMIEMINPRVAVDLYAGKGRLLQALAGHFEQVHAVEKSRHQYAFLTQHLADQPQDQHSPLIKTYCLDNMKFTRTRLGRIKGINYIDCDAYGNPHPLIAEVLNVWKPGEPSVFAVTDGGRMYVMRGSKIQLYKFQPRSAPPGRFLEQAHAAPVRARQLSWQQYELLVRSFWKQLAESHNFQIKDFISFWRKRRRVLYYGVCIEPHRDRMD